VQSGKLPDEIPRSILQTGDLFKITRLDKTQMSRSCLGCNGKQQILNNEKGKTRIPLSKFSPFSNRPVI